MEDQQPRDCLIAVTIILRGGRQIQETVKLRSPDPEIARKSAYFTMKRKFANQFEDGYAVFIGFAD